MNAHVKKMYHNEGSRDHKKHCDSCRKGTREHNWPEKKVFRLSKVRLIDPNSHLLSIKSMM